MSKHLLFALILFIAIALSTNGVLAGHKPPRPQVSYECDRYALKYDPQSDRWVCAPGTSTKESKETKDRIRKLKRDVEARIKALRAATDKLQQEQEQRLKRLINQQQQLIRSLQQN